MCPNARGVSILYGLLAYFCLHYTSHESFYRPCNFLFNILSSFEIIAKTLSVALEVSLSTYSKDNHFRSTNVHEHQLLVIGVISQK